MSQYFPKSRILMIGVRLWDLFQINPCLTKLGLRTAQIQNPPFISMHSIRELRRVLANLSLNSNQSVGPAAFAGERTARYSR